MRWFICVDLVFTYEIQIQGSLVYVCQPNCVITFAQGYGAEQTRLKCSLRVGYRSIPYRIDHWIDGNLVAAIILSLCAKYLHSISVEGERSRSLGNISLHITALRISRCKISCKLAGTNNWWHIQPWALTSPQRRRSLSCQSASHLSKESEVRCPRQLLLGWALWEFGGSFSRWTSPPSSKLQWGLRAKSGVTSYLWSGRHSRLRRYYLHIFWTCVCYAIGSINSPQAAVNSAISASYFVLYECKVICIPWTWLIWIINLLTNAPPIPTRL